MSPDTFSTRPRENTYNLYKGTFRSQKWPPQAMLALIDTRSSIDTCQLCGHIMRMCSVLKMPDKCGEPNAFLTLSLGQIHRWLTLFQPQRSHGLLQHLIIYHCVP